MSSLDWKINRISGIVSLLLALCLFVNPGTGLAQQRSDPSDKAPTASPSDRLTFLTVSVTDGQGGFAWGLPPSVFAVLDDGRPRRIDFFAAKDGPASVGLLLDISGSMNAPMNSRNRIMADVREAIPRFLKIGMSSNDYFLMTFNRSSQLLADWTSDADTILSKLTQLRPDYDTALYDACYLGIEKVSSSRHAKRALIVVTDGDDNASRRRLDDLRRLVHQSDVTLYIIAVTGSDYPVKPGIVLGGGPLHGPLTLDFLALAKASGGFVALPKNGPEMTRSFELIALELHRQFRIGFVPASDGKWHHIKVRITLPPLVPAGMEHLVARTREGYRAQSAP